MKLSKSDLRLVNGVAQEKSRPSLGHVLLRRGRLVAADGFILVMKQVSEEGETLGQEQDVLLPTAMLNLLKPGKHETAEVVLGEDNTLRAVVRELGGRKKDPEFVFNRVDRDVHFPKYEANVPRNEKVGCVALDIKLLKKLLSSLPGEGILRIGVAQPNEAVEFCINDEQERPIRAFQMPMFVPWEGSQWLIDDLKWKGELPPVEEAKEEESEEKKERQA